MGKKYADAPYGQLAGVNPDLISGNLPFYQEGIDPSLIGVLANGQYPAKISMEMREPVRSGQPDALYQEGINGGLYAYVKNLLTHRYVDL